MIVDVQNVLQGAGFSFDYRTIFIGIAFSIIGWGVWRYGRRMQSGRHMILGVVLMAYPYFVSSPWWSLAIGLLLCFFLAFL